MQGSRRVSLRGGLRIVDPVRIADSWTAGQIDPRLTNSPFPTSAGVDPRTGYFCPTINKAHAPFKGRIGL